MRRFGQLGLVGLVGLLGAAVLGAPAVAAPDLSRCAAAPTPTCVADLAFALADKLPEGERHDLADAQDALKAGVPLAEVLSNQVDGVDAPGDFTTLDWVEHYARQGRFAQARKTADTLEGLDDKIVAWAALTRGYARKGMAEPGKEALEEVLDLVDDLEPGSHDRVQQALAVLWTRLGQSDKAQLALAAVEDPALRIAALLAVSGELRDMREPAQAATHVRQARDEAKKLAEPADRANTLIDLIPAFDAVAAAEVAPTLAAAGEAAKQIGPAQGRVSTLGNVARLLQARGLTQESRELIVSLREALPLIADEKRREEAMAVAAGLLAATGDLSEAELVVRSVRDPYRQAAAVTQAARARFDQAAGDPWATRLLNDSRALADQVTDRRQRDAILWNIANTFLNAKRPADAMIPATGVSDPLLLADNALFQGELQADERTRRLMASLAAGRAEDIASPQRKGDVLVRIALLKALAGDPVPSVERYVAQAERTAGPSVAGRGAVALLLAGDLNGAERRLRGVVGDERDNALVLVSGYVLKRGEPGEALRWLSRIENPGIKSRALLELALSLTKPDGA